MTADEARKLTSEYSSERAEEQRKVARRMWVADQIEQILSQIGVAARQGHSSWCPKDSRAHLPDDVIKELEQLGYTIRKEVQSDGPAPSFHFTFIEWR